jgi:hypothetical protein
VLNPLCALSWLDWLGVCTWKLPQLKRLDCSLLSATRLLIDYIKYAMWLFRGESRLSCKTYLWLFEGDQRSVGFFEKLQLLLSGVGISRRDFCGRSWQPKNNHGMKRVTNFLVFIWKLRNYGNMIHIVWKILVQFEATVLATVVL